MNVELSLAVALAAIAGPELDKRIAEYEAGRNATPENMLRDLKAATNLASMLSLAAEDVLIGSGL